MGYQKPGYQEHRRETMMRVGMVVPSLGKRCGISEYSRALAGELENLGGYVRLIPSCGVEAATRIIEQELTLAHFQFEYVLYDIGLLAKTVERLAQAGVSAVATMHDFTPGLVNYNRFIIQGFPDIIVHSQQLARELLMRLTSRDGERVHVIPMGCPSYKLKDEQDVRAALGLGPGPAIGFFGFMLPQKGIIELAMAFKELRRDFPEMQCFIFSSLAPYTSSKRYLAEVESEFTRLGLWEGVILRKEYLPEEEVVQLLHAMDINILPYYDRGFIGTSAAVRTLMAARKPVIATDVPFFSDLDGEIYKIRDPDPGNIVRAVKLLLGDRTLRDRLVSQAGEYVERNSWPNIARRHLKLYDSILQKRKVTAGRVMSSNEQ
ncbi:MAG: glycosyltransferase [Firmicutes bacterium]|nr:glycosyltransferase [Bacillota bacterium]